MKIPKNLNNVVAFSASDFYHEMYLTGTRIFLKDQVVIGYTTSTLLLATIGKAFSLQPWEEERLRKGVG